MKPGDYLRKRREAAGLALADVAAATAIPSVVLNEAEAGQTFLRPEALHPVADFIGFPAGIYLHLQKGDQVRVCRACGCSHWDPCQDEFDGPCSWAEPDLCTACSAKGSSGDA